MPAPQHATITQQMILNLSQPLSPKMVLLKTASHENSPQSLSCSHLHGVTRKQRVALLRRLQLKHKLPAVQTCPLAFFGMNLSDMLGSCASVTWQCKALVSRQQLSVADRSECVSQHCQNSLLLSQGSLHEHRKPALSAQLSLTWLLVHIFQRKS